MTKDQSVRALRSAERQAKDRLEQLLDYRRRDLQVRKLSGGMIALGQPNPNSILAEIATIRSLRAAMARLAFPEL